MGQRFGDCDEIFDESLIEANIPEESSKFLDGGRKREVLDHFDFYLLHL